MLLRMMALPRIAAASLVALVLAAPAAAHPHVFIDAGVEVLIDDQNRATGVRIRWTYDEYYSLFIIGDMGLDSDWDGALTDDERARLSGFDMKWDPGFAGDTYALRDEAELALSRPKDWSAAYEGGKISSYHVRTFDQPVPLTGSPLIVQTYDPGYYVLYTIAFDPVLTGGQDCTATAYAPDITEADEALKGALAEYTPDQDLEADFPAIGKAYAEEIRVTCAAS
jgi:ABC-type uncharacterized transport system substrate-binding protein